MKVMAIVNPVAGMGRGERCGKELIRSGKNLKVVFTSSDKTATDFAWQAVLEGYGRVIAVGGDGTVQQVANGLAQSGIPLGIVPVGCGNDFSKALDIPQNFEDALETALTGKILPVDLGTIDGIYFANVVSFGFDAKLTQRIPATKIKRRSRVFAKLSSTFVYLNALFKELCHKISYPEITVEFQEAGIARVLTRSTTALVVSNGPQYGGMFHIAPAASLTDKILDVCWISKMNRGEIIVNLPKIIFGTHEKLRQVKTLRIPRLTVKSDTDLACQVDGEILPSKKSYNIGIVPAALNVVVPQEKYVLLDKVPAMQFA